MSDLSTFAQHARAMSTAQHKPECKGADWTPARFAISEGSDDQGTTWTATDIAPPKPPTCPGCVTDADRALWARLADEVDAYMSHDEEETLL